MQPFLKNITFAGLEEKQLPLYVKQQQQKKTQTMSVCLSA